MTISVNVSGAWKEGTPDKVNIGGVWKTVSAAKVNVGGVWKDVFPSDTPTGPNLLTNVTWRKTGNTYEVEFTAVGGSGTYFWDYDGDDATAEGGGYGSNVVIHKYKSGGYKTVTCMDMGDGSVPEQQGVKVTITNVSP